MDCPTCKNDPSQSVVTALVNRKGICSMEAHPCPTCDGAGRITLVQYERMATGAHFRNDRIEFHLTISQIAAAAGLSPRQVCDYEQGRLIEIEHSTVRDRLLKTIVELKAMRARA